MEWITQIIVFLLLVMIIEMLIPQTNMKKYIHTVLSLLFLLLFLQPLFQFLNLDVKQATEDAIVQFEDSMDEKVLEKEIDLKKKEIQASQDAYVVKELTVQMEKQVEEELNNTYGLTIVDISFEFDPEDKHDMEKLEEVKVIVEDTKDKNQGEIKQIIIGESENREASNEAMTDKLDKVKAYLNGIWELEEERLVLVWEGGT